MKRLACILLTILTVGLLLCGCRTQENPPTVHVVYKGVLYEVEHYPDETTACALVDVELTDATIIPYDVMPTNEGEINVKAQTAQLCDLDETSFLVIIDGEQYLVPYQ